MASRLIALLMIWLFLPTTAEAVELVVHKLEHGDVAHHADAEQTSPSSETDEHGCAGTLHVCACCRTHVHPPTLTGTLLRHTSAIHLDFFKRLAYDGMGTNPPDIRPPIR